MQWAKDLGFKFTKVNCTNEIFTTAIPMKTVRSVIPAGTICGHRFIGHGTLGDTETVTLIYVHNVCNDQIAEPKITGKIRLDGSPSAIEVEIKGLMPPLEQSFDTSVAPCYPQSDCSRTWMEACIGFAGH